MLFFSLYYDTLSLTSLTITQAFHLLLGFIENQTVFWNFKIRNSVRITEGSDNRGPTVPMNTGNKINCVHSYLPPTNDIMDLISLQLLLVP